jgi:hypothetical protein
MTHYTAFAGPTRIAAGSEREVAAIVRALPPAAPAVLIFEDGTGRQIDLDLRERADGDREERRGRGRPSLGVVAREVTLLPRHWDWLASQSGGASATLRRLVDGARRQDGAASEARAGQEAAYRFLTAMAGDRPGYEEAIRALFAGDRPHFERLIAAWPADIRDHATRLAFAGQ